MTGDVRITRRRLLQTASVGGLALLVPSAALARTARSAKLAENVVLRWNDALLQGVRDSKLGPPMVARALAVAHTCIFDAWAAYDRVAVGTQLGGALRQQSGGDQLRRLPGRGRPVPRQPGECLRQADGGPRLRSRRLLDRRGLR